MIQDIIVASAVIAAFAVSAWKLMPARRRLKLLTVLDGWAARHAALAGWRERTLRPHLLRAAGAGCAGCAANVGIKPHQPPR